MAILIRSVFGMFAALLICGCSQEQAVSEEQAQPAAAPEAGMTIEAAQEQLTATLISMPGVSGIAVGECDGKPCIKVMLEEKTPSLMTEIPSSYKGFPVVIEETGEIHPQQ